MTAWLVALTLASAYLINKNLRIGSRLDQAVKEVNKESESEAIRKVQRTVPLGDRMQDLNLQDLPASDVKKLEQQRVAAAREVVAYEAPVIPEIQGVYLHFDRHGI